MPNPNCCPQTPPPAGWSHSLRETAKKRMKLALIALLIIILQETLRELVSRPVANVIITFFS